MRALLDTNIIIPLEDTRPLYDQKIATLASLASQHNCKLLVHPLAADDLSRDKDPVRRATVLSKLSKYAKLWPAPSPTQDFLQRVGTTTHPNDQVDNALLYAVACNAVHFLITEDKYIHKKARHLGLSARVYYVDQFVSMLRRLFESESFLPPSAIDTIPLYMLDIRDPFFQSLKNDYSTFESWFTEKAREGREAWLFRDPRGGLGALCIYKLENPPDIPGLSGKALKLCTFKVGDHVRGQKVGELLLKTAFQYALQNYCDLIYLTVLPDKEHLMAFLEQFGFGRASRVPTTGEWVFVKTLCKVAEDIPILDYNIKYYPYFRCDPSIRKFIVPVLPKYHKILFPELDVQQSVLPFVPPPPVSNAIKKAYICNSPSKRVQKGDIVIFYRSRDMKSVTTVGFVEDVLRSDDPDEIAAFVGKRTVYSYDDIKELANKGALAIMFRQIQHLKSALRYDRIVEMGVIRRHPESITEITHDSFVKLMGDQIHDCVSID